jgi:hypothetical protein
MVNLAQALEDRRPERALELSVTCLAMTRRMLERQLSVLTESDRFTWAAMQRYALDLVLTLTARHPTLGDQSDLYQEVAAWKGQVSRGLLQERLWLQKQTRSEVLADMKQLEQVLGSISQLLFQAASAGDEPSPVELERLTQEREAIERRLAAQNDRVASGSAVQVEQVSRQLGRTGSSASSWARRRRSIARWRSTARPRRAACRARATSPVCMRRPAASRNLCAP